MEAAGIDFEIREGLEGLTPARIATLYRRAPLFRPVDSAEDVWKMYKQSTYVFAAWRGGHVVGIARVLSDGVLQSYLCDLAVEPDVQRTGIGRALLDSVIRRCTGTELFVSAPYAASSFYERMGFSRVGSAYVTRVS